MTFRPTWDQWLDLRATEQTIRRTEYPYTMRCACGHSRARVMFGDTPDLTCSDCGKRLMPDEAERQARLRRWQKDTAAGAKG